MKRERQLAVYDCARTTRAIANAAGKIVFLWQADMKKPRQKGRGGKREGRNKHAGMGH